MWRDSPAPEVSPRYLMLNALRVLVLSSSIISCGTGTGLLGETLRVIN